MEKSIELGGLVLGVSAEDIRELPEGLLLTGSQVGLSLPQFPARYLRHGWQSWSLAAWTDISPLPLQRPRILHPLQVDPQYVDETLPHGSWFGAVEFEDGNILLLGALGLDTHVRLDGGRLEGSSENGTPDWIVLFGDERGVFAEYARRVGASLADARRLEGLLGRIEKKPAPRIWCSWYSLYSAIDEPLLHQTFDALEAFPFDVLQVDDGWQLAIGDWQPNAKFPSGMAALAANIKGRGRRAGLWLAPLIAAESSQLFREHPDWFLKNDRGRFVSAGFNWGEHTFALDTTHPEVLVWLQNLMQQVRAWGFDYLKLDFLYAGALPGKRHQHVPREFSYRSGLKALREGMGQDAYFLACGAPIIPSLGICDALRVGPDVAGEWENHRDAVLLANPTVPGTRNAIRTTLHRLWLNPLVRIDPDVAYFASRGNSLSPKQKRLLQDLALICGFKATSDLPQWLEPLEREQLLQFLANEPVITRTGRYSFEVDGRKVDFSDLIALPSPAAGLDRVQSPLMAWIADQPWALKIFARMNKNSWEKMKSALMSNPQTGDHPK